MISSSRDHRGWLIDLWVRIVFCACCFFRCVVYADKVSEKIFAWVFSVLGIYKVAESCDFI